MQPLMTTTRSLAAAAALFALAGCLNLGKGAPPELLNLTATAAAPAGAAASGRIGDAIAVIDLAAPERLDVARVPVTLNGSSLAYLKDAQWVEKPAELFTGLLTDTLRARGKHLVIAGSDLQYSAAYRLSGTLSAMDYDASSEAVVVRYDAVLRQADGTILTRRFEATESGVAAKPGPVGAALNRAANDVAGQVADWIG
jgi:cholesterol transport system auxiliary component